MTTQPEPGQALSVGAVVADTYQVTRLLGRGGMGSVWEASHLRLPGKRVAIKVLHADVAADQEALARFRREAEIATRLGHPNIVEVHDFNSLPDGQPYLVLELLVGESLDARMRRAPVSLDNAMRIAGQIGAALAAAHREQVIHRDLKPQNVFLVRPRADEPEGSGELVKVLDFGISKIRGSQTVKTLDSTILGTPQYMAPEQATGNHAAVDQRTDVFALAAIVYEMLSGRPAFSGQSIPEVVFKVVYESPPPLADLVPGLPRRVTDAVERALAKKQDERFPDVVSFVEQMAGVSLSTLRRAPLSFAPAAMDALDTMNAAGLTLEPRQQSGGDPVQAKADPLANTVDSGRRERAPLAEDAAAAEPRPPGVQHGRKRALLAAISVLAVAAAGTVIALAMRSSGDETRRKASRARRPPAVTASSERSPTPTPGSTSTPTDPGRQGEASPPEEPATPPAPAEAQVAKLRPDEENAANPEAETRPGEAAAKEPRPAPGAAAKQRRPPRDEQEEEAADFDPAKGETRGELRAALLEGEDALGAGDFRQALVLAERALRHGGGVAAHALRARASCGIGDLGNAKASFLRIPRRNQFLRRRVLGFCTRSGVELGP